MQVLQFKDVPGAENGFRYVLYPLERNISPNSFKSSPRAAYCKDIPEQAF
jgi:hypothetical protein